MANYCRAGIKSLRGTIVYVFANRLCRASRQRAVCTLNPSDTKIGRCAPATLLADTMHPHVCPNTSCPAHCFLLLCFRVNHPLKHQAYALYPTDRPFLVSRRPSMYCRRPFPTYRGQIPDWGDKVDSGMGVRSTRA
jgi:hypothetical protein